MLHSTLSSTLLDPVTSSQPPLPKLAPKRPALSKRKGKLRNRRQAPNNSNYHVLNGDSAIRSLVHHSYQYCHKSLHSCLSVSCVSKHYNTSPSNASIDMSPFNSNTSPSTINKMEADGQKHSSRRRSKMSFSYIFGDPFQLAMISISIVTMPNSIRKALRVRLTNSFLSLPG